MAACERRRAIIPARRHDRRGGRAYRAVRTGNPGWRRPALEPRPQVLLPHFCRTGATMTLYTVEPERATLHGTFSRDFAPILTIDPGDTVRFRTLDAGWNVDPRGVGPDGTRAG